MCPGLCAVGTLRHCTTRIYLANHRDQHRQAPQHAQQPRAVHLPGTPGGRSVNRMCLCTGEIPAAAVQPRHLVCTEAVHGSQWLQLLAQRHRSLNQSPLAHTPTHRSQSASDTTASPAVALDLPVPMQPTPLAVSHTVAHISYVCFGIWLPTQLFNLLARPV